MVSGPVAGACSPLVPRLLLVEDFFEVASEDLAEDLVWVEAVRALGELPFERARQVGLLRPIGNLWRQNNNGVRMTRRLGEAQCRQQINLCSPSFSAFETRIPHLIQIPNHSHHLDPTCHTFAWETEASPLPFWGSAS